MTRSWKSQGHGKPGRPFVGHALHRAFRVAGLIGLLLWFTQGLPASERQIVLDAMDVRPSGIWPRGFGHVLLGIPGSTEDEKAYLEPGGSFSPGFGTFGIQLLAENADGEVEVASDFVPRVEMKQSWVWPLTATVPGVRTETPDYSALWSMPDGRHWRLDLSSRRHPHVVVSIRSLGPAGGPVTNAIWDGRAIRINDRWDIVAADTPREIRIGYQNPTNLAVGEITSSQFGLGPRIVRSTTPSTGLDQTNGWGRIVLVFGRETTLIIEDRKPPTPNPLAWQGTLPGVTLDIPDDRFTDSLKAQVAQMLMGLVGTNSRPVDPNHHPVSRMRESATIAVALARAGQMGVSQQLCGTLAREDFLGEMGAEADGPGLSLWAVLEVAAIVRNKTFDQSLLPHVDRKVRLIESLLQTPEPFRIPWTGPLAPRRITREEAALVADASQDGLIQGRVGKQRPVLYVNATAYAGLRSAAIFYNRINRRPEAGRLSSLASVLQLAWNQSATRRTTPDAWTAATGPHPSWIAEDPKTWQTLLLAARTAARTTNDLPKLRPENPTPLATEAHQWLLLGDPKRAWHDLNWFWSNQVSPDLYSWWEGSGDEDFPERWEGVRGWVMPPYLSPQFGTAAEITLLQLAMLAHADESTLIPILVVGAGVPREWLDDPIRVESLQTAHGPVTWTWDPASRRVRVRAPGFPQNSVRLAGGFTQDAALEVIR